MAVVGLVIEILLGAWLSGRGAGGLALVLFVAYLVIGIIVLIQLRGERPEEPQSWSVEVLARTIRGADRQRSLPLQILVWLTIGQLIGAAVAVYAIVEAVGSLGF